MNSDHRRITNLKVEEIATAIHKYHAEGRIDESTANKALRYLGTPAGRKQVEDFETARVGEAVEVVLTYVGLGIV